MAGIVPPHLRKRPFKARLSEPKDRVITIYLTTNEWKLFKAFCFELDIAMNKFVRKLILQAIQPGWIELKEKDEL